MFNNNGQHLHRIIAEKPCKRHRVPEGSPCWTLANDNPAVCGARIRAVGFNGQVSSQSIRITKAPKKSPRSPKTTSKK